MLFFASQIFAFFGLATNVVSFQRKTKTSTLLFVATANVFMTASYVFLRDWVGAAFFAIATFRVTGFIFLDKYRARSTDQWLPVLALLFFWGAHSAAALLTWQVWFDFVLLAGVLAFTYGCWAKGPHPVRVSRVIYSSLLIVHNIGVKNWVAIVGESALIASIFIYYAKPFCLVPISKSLNPQIPKS